MGQQPRQERGAAAVRSMSQALGAGPIIGHVYENIKIKHAIGGTTVVPRGQSTWPGGERADLISGHTQTSVFVFFLRLRFFWASFNTLASLCLMSLV